MSDDDIVISGFSARFPQADSLTEFAEKLYRGDDFVTDDDTRWPRGFLGLPHRMGTIRDLSKFDAQFFGVHPKQADLMDPQLRLLLETSYEAIIDAGYDPATLRGGKIGVFVGCSQSGTAGSPPHSGAAEDDGYIMLGGSLSMFSNRISYSLDFHGPSGTVDTACSSTMTALNNAVLAIRSGQCEAAIVGGCNVLLNPANSLALQHMAMLSNDGKCKVLDADANGYVRSETVGAIFLQRGSKARRVYAKLVHIWANSDGYKTEGITHPSRKAQEELFREVYAETCVDPHDICYVEIHGTGTKVGDPEEVAAISSFFCQSPRERPLMIGSVKSNVGHAEGASGISSIAKVILAMERGVIAGNLHFTEPNPKISSILDGTIEVVDRNKPFVGAFAGINSSGFGGTTVHTILQAPSGPHVKSLPRLKPELPRLVLVAGRNADTLATTLEKLEKEAPHSDSMYALLNNVGQPNSKHFPFRGFSVIPPDGAGRDAVTGTPEEAPLKRRPLWFVFTGMGCQWNGMARQMMHFDVFSRSIHKSHEVLKQFNLDLIALVTSEDLNTQSPASTFVSITALQVGLIDMLSAVGVRPDGLLGHSLGEIGCAYADGALSAEQAVLCAYWRGHCVESGNLPEGAMAVVGLTWEEAVSRCPNDVFPACHNAADFVTMSGLADPVARFIEELKAENVFVSRVNSPKFAFHCPHIRSIEPTLREALEKVIPEPKLRSSNWISSSVPERCWEKPTAKLCSADYFVNNFVSPVFFYEALQHVPRDAILIEIAPHSLLQGILRGALSHEATCLGLMKRDSENPTLFLRTLGQLHVLGVQLDLRSLYPPVAWPVPRGTPGIGHFVSWDHSQSWRVAGWEDFANNAEGAEEVIDVDLTANEADAYLADRKLNGQVVFPAAAYMVLAWKSLTANCGKPFDQVPVIFEHITIHQDIVLRDSDAIRFLLHLKRDSGHFQVNKGDIVAASGRIRLAEEDINLPNVEPPCTPEGAVVYQLQAEDVYKELRLRGYECNGVFRGISKADIPIEHGKLKWEDNWVTFIDAMLQFLALNNPLRTSALPTSIEYCCVDPQVQARIIENGGHAGIDVVCERSLNTCRAGGAVIQNVTYSPTSLLSDQQEPLLEAYCFVPYFDSNSDRQQRQAYVKDYAEMCSAITRRILDRCDPNGTNPYKLLPEVYDIHAKTLHRFPEYSAENHGLLRTLITVLDSVNDSPSSLVTGVQSAQSLHKKNLEADLLNTALYTEDPLRHLLEIVTENTFANKINILELVLEKGSLVMAPWVCSLLSILNSGRKMEYAVSHAFPDCLRTEELCEGIKIVSSESVFSSEGELPEADLVIARVHTGDSIELNSLPKKLSSHCKRNAFVLISTRTALTPAELFLNRVSNRPFKVPACEALQTAFEDNGFRLVAHKSNNLSSLLLFRYCLSPVESFKQEMVTVNSSDFEWVETLKQKSLKCERGPPGRTIWLLAGNTGISGIVGLATCLSLENVGRHIRYVFDASHSGSNKLSNFAPSNPEYRDVVERDLIANVYCDGQWGSYRHIVTQSSDAPKKTTQFAYLNMDPGNLSSVKWYESSLPYKFPSAPRSTDRVLCSVYYAPLNKRDVMIATSKVRQDALPRYLATSDSVLGIEFSGRDPLGRRVMGLVASEAMATVVAADQDFLWEVPPPWSLQEASTVPFAYSTAYYALLVRGNMRTGESLLVHAGSCDVGQAAISIALSIGCTVFATVGSDEEHQFLRYRFPELNERHIVNSTMTSLERNVLLKTEGRGVDLVLYSRAKESVQASLRCLSPHGRFLDISPPEDIAHDVSLGKSALLKSITFYSIPPDALFADNSVAAVKSLVAQLVRDGIMTGAVQPLDTTIFGRDKAEEAFGFMASASHIGKVVLEIRQEENERKAVPASPLNVEAVARTWFYHRKSYVIIGGLGGVGLELAEWMVSKGCCKLLLCSRSGVRNGYQRLCLHRWERSGVKVLVSTADASTEKGCREIIEKAMTLGPVGGVFNLALVLRDALLENQSAGAYKAVCMPKVDITQRLDELTRGLCPQLDHFVVFSSIVCGRGNVGQTNYGYANSVMERICERRAADGFPALAIQWGAIADVGIFHKAFGLDFGIHGTLPQRITSCLEVLDRLLNQNSPVVSCCVKADQSPKSRNQDTQDLVQLIAHILGVKDSSSLKPHVTLGELGLDSMIGLKVLHTIERHCGLVLSMQNIGQLNVKHLEEMSKGPTAECQKSPKR